MAYKFGTHLVRRVKLGFKRQQTQHQVAVRSNLPYATLAPRPNLRANVLHGAKAAPMQLLGQTEIKFRRIDANEHIGFRGDNAFD